MSVKYGDSSKILSESGIKFKKQLFMEITSQLGVEHKMNLSLYHPQSNGRIKGFHTTFSSHVYQNIFPRSLELDQVIPLVCITYNFSSNKHSNGGNFFPIFGSDPVVPFNSLLNPKVRHLVRTEYLIPRSLEKYILCIGSQWGP